MTLDLILCIVELKLSNKEEKEIETMSLFFLIIFSLNSLVNAANLVCYYPNWSTYRTGIFNSTLQRYSIVYTNAFYVMNAIKIEKTINNFVPF